MPSVQVSFSQEKGVRSKPLLRGWSHAGAALVALPLTIVLCWECRHDPPRLLSVLVFGLSMLSLYTVSAVYHIGRWRSPWQRFFHAFDHSNIFLLIAGTYTPILFNILSGWQRIAMLGLVWTLAVSGVVLSVFKAQRIPRPVKISLYSGLGWLGLLALPAAIEALPWPAVGLMLLGGFLYSVGAVVYGLRWPNPSPRFFGFHEIFHLFVIAGGTMFLLAIWGWIVPFPRP